jgi:hypothetical protein
MSTRHRGDHQRQLKAATQEVHAQVDVVQVSARNGRVDQMNVRPGRYDWLSGPRRRQPDVLGLSIGQAPGG